MPPSSQSSSPVFAKPEGFQLLDLSLEIQDMILGLCLATGNTQVLFLSKRVHARAVSLLYRDAIFRLDNRDVREVPTGPIGMFRVYAIPSRLPASKMRFIQNICMHIDIDIGATDDNAMKNLQSNRDSGQGPIIDFTRRPWTRIPRRRTFQLSISRKDAALHIEAEAFGKAIKGLTTFEFVTVTAITKMQGAGESKEPYQPNEKVFRARNKGVYNVFRQEWEGTLGPAKFFDSFVQGGRYLEFRPREHLASLAAGSN